MGVGVNVGDKCECVRGMFRNAWIAMFPYFTASFLPTGHLRWTVCYGGTSLDQCVYRHCTYMSTSLDTSKTMSITIRYAAYRARL